AEQEDCFPKRVARIERVAEQLLDQVERVPGERLGEEAPNGEARGIGIPRDRELIRGEDARCMRGQRTGAPVEQAVAAVDQVERRLMAEGRESGTEPRDDLLKLLTAEGIADELAHALLRPVVAVRPIDAMRVAPQSSIVAEVDGGLGQQVFAKPRGDEAAALVKEFAA